MRSIVLTTLSIFLGLFFVFLGTMKLSQVVSREIHREIRRNFVQFAKFFPFVNQLGYRVSPRYYRLIWGYLEVTCGLVLVLIPGPIKLWANSILALLSLGSIYNHYTAKDKFDRIAPCIVFSLMLICRLIVHYQVRRRELRSAQNKIKFIENSTYTNGNNHNNGMVESDKTK